MKKNNFLILKQGYNVILFTLLLSVFTDIFISDLLSYFGYSLVLILLFVYRNPSRNNFTNDKNNIFSLVDGKIISIDKSKNKVKLYINVSMCNTHLVTAPKTSFMNIKSIKSGLNLDASTYKARKLNNQIILKFDNMKVRFISGLCNTELNFINAIDVKAGDELGIFLQGLVIVELNINSKLEVKLNDKVYANKTILVK